jgi:hypothetical protein
LILVGVAVIALSFVWPTNASQRGGWSLEQARRYQAAAIKLHGLSHDVAHASADREAAIRAELNSAKTEYGALRNDLDAAISRPRRWSWILRTAGILALILGGTRLFTLPKDDLP